MIVWNDAELAYFRAVGQETAWMPQTLWDAVARGAGVRGLMQYSGERGPGGYESFSRPEETEARSLEEAAAKAGALHDLDVHVPGPGLRPVLSAEGALLEFRFERERQTSRDFAFLWGVEKGLPGDPNDIFAYVSRYKAFAGSPFVDGLRFCGRPTPGTARSRSLRSRRTTRSTSCSGGGISRKRNARPMPRRSGAFWTRRRCDAGKTSVPGILSPN